MSLAQKALEAIKSLFAPATRTEEEVKVEQRQQPTTQPSRRPENAIGEALGISPGEVAKVCYRSEAATEWCRWIVEVLAGRRRDPPAKQIPDDVLPLLMQLVERGFRDPLFERVIESRKRLLEAIGRAEKAIDDVSKALVMGKLKVASGALRDALERLVSEVKSLRGDVDKAVEAFTARLEEVLREKYKVPLREGELAAKVVEGLRTMGLEKTVEKTVEFMASRFKRMEKPPPLKEAFREDKGGAEAGELELRREPVKRI
ncbi:MAG: hypothetical protein QXZ31_03750 [Thermofilaceae archaeon]